jgi:hypothetical protein
MDLAVTGYARVSFQGRTVVSLQMVWKPGYGRRRAKRPDD